LSVLFATKLQAGPFELLCLHVIVISNSVATCSSTFRCDRLDELSNGYDIEICPTNFARLPYRADFGLFLVIRQPIFQCLVGQITLINWGWV
jgi:hypothetical protein